MKKKQDFILHSTFKSLPGYWKIRGILDSLRRVGNKEHWARVVMNRETQGLINLLQPTTLDVLEISGNAWGKSMAFRNYKSVQYPEFDICESVLAETFDLIIAEQVFEHLLWPYRSGKNVYKMLNPGGHFLISTPFLIRIHDVPVDCTRWTETGIKYFLNECGFELEYIQTGSWGNRACIKANFSTWTKYRRPFHSLRNEPLFPIVVWALARK